MNNWIKIAHISRKRQNKKIGVDKLMSGFELYFSPYMRLRMCFCFFLSLSLPLNGINANPDMCCVQLTKPTVTNGRKKIAKSLAKSLSGKERGKTRKKCFFKCVCLCMCIVSEKLINIHNFICIFCWLICVCSCSLSNRTQPYNI